MICSTLVSHFNYLREMWQKGQLPDAEDQAQEVSKWKRLLQRKKAVSQKCRWTKGCWSVHKYIHTYIPHLESNAMTWGSRRTHNSIWPNDRPDAVHCPYWLHVHWQWGPRIEGFWALTATLVISTSEWSMNTNQALLIRSAAGQALLCPWGESQRNYGQEDWGPLYPLSEFTHPCHPHVTIVNWFEGST